MFVVMLVAAASQFLLGATRLGRYMYALGSNIEAARRGGVNVTGVTVAAYGLASLFAAVGGMLLVARLTMGNPNAGMGAELQGDRRRGRRRAPACSADAGPLAAASSARSCSPPSATAAQTCLASIHSGRW